MSGYRRRRLMRLAQVLTMASVASAVSLQDFQAISISQVPSLPCLSAYGNTILGCSRSDFQDGNQCSASCAQGIIQDQANVMEACKNVEVDNKSLLGLALLGGLLDALCPNLIATPATSTLTPTNTPSESQETSTPTTTIQSETGVPDTIVSPTDTMGATSVPPVSSPSATPEKGDHDGSPFPGSSGGGSPFDTVLTGNSERVLSVVSMAITPAVALIVMFSIA
ncbi:hypothetical protein GGR50DRAFT_99720 [Xylaria sp. CBS 124048]|nr:hypothetical protein GGR50DRAFT_99720 [Xylaria sp. CBS 124048]